MDEEERAALEALPDQVTVYRGCGPDNKDGFSWSLKREVAEGFPYKALYGTDQPILLTATVLKKKIAALKLGRNEHEAILFEMTPDCWTEEPLPKPEPKEERPKNPTAHKIVSELFRLASTNGTRSGLGVEIQLANMERDLSKELGMAFALISLYLSKWQERGMLKLEPGRIILTDEEGLSAILKSAS